MIVTQRLEVEERRVDGKVRGRSKRGRERGRKGSMIITIQICWFNYPVSFLIASSFIIYPFKNPTSSLVNDHLHKSIEH